MSLEQDRARRRKWAEANPEKLLESGRKYWKAHTEEARIRMRKWRAANPEKQREARRKREAAHPGKESERVRRWRAANPDKVRSYNARRSTLKAGNGGSYTDVEWQTLCAQYGNQCIGPGPHGGPLCADHVIPVGEPGSTSNITNIQPLCKRCNSRKGTKTIDYRLPK